MLSVAYRILFSINSVASICGTSNHITHWFIYFKLLFAFNMLHIVHFCPFTVFTDWLRKMINGPQWCGWMRSHIRLKNQLFVKHDSFFTLIFLLLPLCSFVFFSVHVYALCTFDHFQTSFNSYSTYRLFVLVVFCLYDININGQIINLRQMNKWRIRMIEWIEYVVYCIHLRCI